MKKTVLLFAVLALIFASCTNESLNENSEISNQSNSLISNFNEITVINFDGFSAGEIVSEVSPNGCSGSIAIMAVNPDFPGMNTAMIFDSSNPTGNDFDLGTPNEMYGGPGISSDGPRPSNDVPLGNVLIISEDMDSSDPDDSARNGTRFELDFSGYGNGMVTLHSFDMLDLEPVDSSGLPTVITLYDGSNNILLQHELPYGFDNEKQLIDLESTSGVVRMVLEMNNSGAIDNIRLTCHREIQIGECETMFAKGNDDIATCFIGNGFNRWGWTNGPLSTGVYIMDIYAGAGRCITENREPAGTVTLDYNAETGDALVTYSVDAGYVLTETHLYLGNGPYPLKRRGNNGWVPTVAPGQYPYQHGSLDNVSVDSYKVNGLSGDIYMIAHGVICELIGMTPQ
ncbi:hypothetical protein [Formosa maritima]|uniref:Uncharacterized protein n=1 Tax=Formosa maritima TaxID=2592046 RepID=A0A5D0G0D2_9FLAO|nr:hypothetical protein [Formosa maritima]TYA52318.1 hypothetical protein FVF61_13330 [Formosa maritima]